MPRRQRHARCLLVDRNPAFESRSTIKFQKVVGDGAPEGSAGACGAQPPTRSIRTSLAGPSGQITTIGVGRGGHHRDSGKSPISHAMSDAASSHPRHTHGSEEASRYTRSEPTETGRRQRPRSPRLEGSPRRRQHPIESKGTLPHRLGTAEPNRTFGHSYHY